MKRIRPLGDAPVPIPPARRSRLGLIGFAALMWAVTRMVFDLDIIPTILVVIGTTFAVSLLFGMKSKPPKEQRKSKPLPPKEKIE